MGACSQTPPAVGQGPNLGTEAYVAADAAFTAMVQGADIALAAGKLSPGDGLKAVQYEHQALGALRIARTAVDNDPTTIPGAIEVATSAIANANALFGGK